MEFRDLRAQYHQLKPEIDKAIQDVLVNANYISGQPVSQLEDVLAAYVGRKHCITCGNGTDALTLALMAWNIGEGDAVFVPDFTFFASGETPAYEGATPIFVDIQEETFNMDPESLRKAVEKVIAEGKLNAKAIVTVDLFGQPADYDEIACIAEEYHLLLLEDAAQGFGGSIRGRLACSFGDISCTSFFPAKPLGCYGDGGAVFTDNDEWAELIRSYRIHGKGADKYDNVRIGMNSRLDTLQAAVLLVKFQAFKSYELEAVNKVAGQYTEKLKDIVRTPLVKEGYRSSWAQYCILLKDKEQRDGLQMYLREQGIPSMIYYPKPMHRQGAFGGMACVVTDLNVSDNVCDRILALPMHPYMSEEDTDRVVYLVQDYVRR